VSERTAACPSCGAGGMREFYGARGVPVHSVLLMPTRERAVGYPRGDVRLAACATCGFISNAAFDPSVHEYSPEYEETQGYSSEFNAFADRLAGRLVERYGVRGKTVLEIGCGKGEFLARMVELGGNRGVGIDPAVVPERFPEPLRDRVELIQDFWSPAYADLPGDFVCCRHTLEHLGDVGRFVADLRAAIGARGDVLLFLEVPETLRVLDEGAFWDVYYEHCSYFTPGSLARLVRRSGFEILELSLDFHDQYLVLVARPASAGAAGTPLPIEEDLDDLAERVARFETRAPERIEEWRRRIAGDARSGRRVVLWGGGSKAVAFLTTLGLRDEVIALADLNPFKQGKFVPGTGHEVVSPERLREIRPDVVVAMNPAYREEIRRDLARLGLAPELLALE